VLYWPDMKADTKRQRLVAVKAILITKDRKILMLRKNNGSWDLPGGKVDKGEKPLKALKREVQEETGIRIKKRDVTYVSSWFKRERGKRPRLVIVCYAMIGAKSQKMRVKLSSEHRHSRFLSFKKAGRLKLDQGYRHAIRVAELSL